MIEIIFYILCGIMFIAFLFMIYMIIIFTLAARRENKNMNNKTKWE